MNRKCLTPILLFLVFLLNSSGNVVSQNFLDTSSVWSIWYDCTGEGGGNIGFRIRLTEPVDSGGMWQSGILFSRNQNPDEWISHFGKLREDSSGNIYLNSTLLYNFSLLPGDTFGDMRCITVDSVQMNGNYRQRWIFQCLSGSLPGFDTADVWVAGIGSLHGLFYPGAWFCSLIVGNPFTQLICFHQAGNLIFMSSSFADCLHSSNYYAPEKWPAGLNNYWSYNYEEQNGFGGINLGNVLIRSLQDAVINGFSCRKYSSLTVNHLNQTLSNITFYIRQTGTTVYYSFGGPFYELFDLEADAGDSWTTRNPYEIFGLTAEPDSLTTFTVDSVFYDPTYFSWSPFCYRNLVISSSSDWKFKLPVMEITGGHWFFFPGKWDDWAAAHPAGLRCCNNNSWEPPPYSYQMPCFFLSTSLEEIDTTEFQLYTFEDHIDIEHNFPPSDKISACLYDIYGRLLYQSQNYVPYRIIVPTNGLPAGIYLLRITNNNGNLLTKKVFKP
ncbi:MAG: T9SS type A sorting domain-containing protein [Bacteroidetes bacterium]|nr:T9SS type A sorting domain-containing protein [Bacteroidota bacterium]